MNAPHSVRLNTGEIVNRLSLVGIVILLDQMSKFLVQRLMQATGENLDVFPLLNIVAVYNRGAAFSFLATAGGWQKWFFIVLAIVVCVWIVRLLLRPEETLAPAGLIMILGGAIGNLVDRIRLGAVFDFIDVHWGGWHYPAFNIADTAICLGVLLIILPQWRAWRAGRAAEQD